MSVDYKSMYLRLANAANDTLDALDDLDTLKAVRLLREGLLAAEEIYVQTDNTEEND